MARLTEVDPPGEVADRLRRRRGGSLTALDRILLHSQPLADGWNALLGAVRTRFTLAADLREMAICRVAVLNRAEYEWRAHAPLLRRAGFTAAQVEALREDGDPSVLGPLHRACLAFTDAMTRDVAVPEAVFAPVREALGERGTAELTATVAAYNMVSRFLVALAVGQEADG